MCPQIWLACVYLCEVCDVNWFQLYFSVYCHSVEECNQKCQIIKKTRSYLSTLDWVQPQRTQIIVLTTWKCSFLSFHWQTYCILERRFENHKLDFDLVCFIHETFMIDAVFQSLIVFIQMLLFLFWFCWGVWETPNIVNGLTGKLSMYHLPTYILQ